MHPSQDEWQRLIEAAQAASDRAYCRYSEFPVGAALLSQDGRIFSGCNVENASFGLTICAERNAIFHAVAEGMTEIRAMAVFTPTAHPTMPCGACRQVLHEFGRGAIVRGVCDSPEIKEQPMSVLLPEAFGPENL